MWVRTKERKPEHDGYYLVYMCYDEVGGLHYTKESGWNTYRVEGKLYNESVIDDSFVSYWLDAPEPPKEAADEV